MIVNRYQLWQDRGTGRYVAVRLEGSRVAGMSDSYPVPPRALSLPTLRYRPPPPDRSPTLADARWRLFPGVAPPIDQV